MLNKETKRAPWKTTDNRFVAFFDILGFKDKVMRNTHEEIYKQLSNISMTKWIIEHKSEDEEFMIKFGEADSHIINFSDSIAIFSKNDDIENFIYFLTITNYLFTNTIKNNIPLKGGIAHGKISVNKSEQIFFGQPIIDAYLIEEQVNYFGITAHNSIDKYINLNKEKMNHPVFKKALFEAKTPLKSGYIEHLNINWFVMANILNNNEEQIDNISLILNEFKNTASGSARKYLDNTIDLFEKNKKDSIFL